MNISPFTVVVNNEKLLKEAPDSNCKSLLISLGTLFDCPFIDAVMFYFYSLMTTKCVRGGTRAV